MGNTQSPKVPSFKSVTVSNPYATAYVGEAGANYTLNPFLTEQNKTIENTVPQLYQRLVNPSLDDTVSLARRQAFEKVFNNNSKTAFENNLVNPLSQRGMLRSSLLNDLANNLQQNQTSQIADFNNNLLANSINDTQALANFYMNQYANNSNFGQNALNSAFTNSNAVNSYNLNAYKNSLNSNDWLKNIRLASQLSKYII